MDLLFVISQKKKLNVFILIFYLDLNRIKIKWLMIVFQILQHLFKKQKIIIIIIHHQNIHFQNKIQIKLVIILKSKK